MSGAVQDPSGEHLFRAADSTAFCERGTGVAQGLRAVSVTLHQLTVIGSVFLRDSWGVFSDSPGQNFLAMEVPGKTILNLSIPIDRVRKF